MFTNTHQIYTGGWFQKNTIHLDLLFDFLSQKKLTLNTGLNVELVEKYFSNLSIISYQIVNDSVDYIEFITSHDYIVRYFEDGLYTIYKTCTFDLINDESDRILYFNKDILVPFLSLIFSQGAPIDKLTSSDVSDQYIYIVEEINSKIDFLTTPLWQYIHDESSTISTIIKGTTDRIQVSKINNHFYIIAKDTVDYDLLIRM